MDLSLVKQSLLTAIIHFCRGTQFPHTDLQLPASWFEFRSPVFESLGSIPRFFWELIHSQNGFLLSCLNCLFRSTTLVANQDLQESGRLINTHWKLQGCLELQGYDSYWANISRTPCMNDSEHSRAYTAVMDILRHNDWNSQHAFDSFID